MKAKSDYIKFVYSLQSENNPDKYYVGLTTSIDQRLKEHNAGKSIHTNKFKPWKVVSYVAFSDEIKAKKFEAYLKTGSGRDFVRNTFNFIIASFLIELKQYIWRRT